MRKLFLSAAAVIGAAVVATSAAAGDGQAATSAGEKGSTEQATGGKEEPKLVCRTIVQTGTRIRRHKKVCASPQEWQNTSDAIADDFHGLSGNPIVPETSNVPS